LALRAKPIRIFEWHGIMMTGEGDT